MYDVRRLRLLRELALRGTLAAVAEALQYSPSAVSQQLTQLEREVGVPLLRPVGRRVTLTPAALALVEHTGRILDDLERAESEVSALASEVTGIVRLAIFQSAALALLPGALTELRDEHPRVRLETVQQEPGAALRDTWMRDFDLVVAEEYPGHATPRHPGLDHRPLVQDALRLAVPAGSPIRTLADARDATWVAEPSGAASRHWMEQRCRVAGFEPDIRIESADLQAHMRLIESGNAVALMPDLAWVERGTTATLIALPDAPRRAVFTAAREASAGRPALVAVRTALEHRAAALDA